MPSPQTGNIQVQSEQGAGNLFSWFLMDSKLVRKHKSIGAENENLNKPLREIETKMTEGPELKEKLGQPFSQILIVNKYLEKLLTIKVIYLRYLMSPLLKICLTTCIWYTPSLHLTIDSYGHLSGCQVNPHPYNIRFLNNYLLYLRLFALY